MGDIYRRRFFGPRRFQWDNLRFPLTLSSSKLYLHNVNANVPGALPGASSQSATSPAETAAGASTNRNMDFTIGASQTSVSVTILSLDATVWHRRFVSP